MLLDEARFKRKITQLQLGLMTEIHQTLISRFELGFQTPTEIQQKLIAKALKFDISEIQYQKHKMPVVRGD